MLSFLGLRKESKKSPSEKEADGGFTIVGETLEEQRGKTRTQSVAQPSSGYVIVQPPKASCPYPALASDIKRPAPLPPPSSSSSVGESSSVLPDLLEDVPFSLSPHVLTVMSSLQLIPDLLLDPELSYNLSSFQYDFSLENSVLRNA
ncbi:UBAP1-MVB12-associated (UMA)-domain containing protein 1 isoform X5 [Pseudochaenichthys georgianus]|uniref:UBAP1-MVB12-associated (UMA)-domain containing protein 1 isoform X5 n=1 Tax=Pseudochaenichthys georgianus TaxID=52239 RepID=UPI00146ADB52|nr:UBAP1-MVB12-associated (UMA)-domain containing protein 1 isoform X3 [Pseudochaenichthys georgianus]